MASSTVTPFNPPLSPQTQQQLTNHATMMFDWAQLQAQIGGQLADVYSNLTNIYALISTIDNTLTALQTAINGFFTVRTFYPSRAIGNVYQNPSSVYTMLVSVQIGFSTTSQIISVLSDASNPPTTLTSELAGGAVTGGAFPLIFMVLPNQFYKLTVNTGVPSVFNWLEWTHA